MYQINWPLVFWLLMMVGGEIVQLAFAKSISMTFLPVPLSFGWFQYFFNNFVTYTSCNSRKLMLINAKSGYVRDNYSPVLDHIFSEWVACTPAKSALNVEIFKLVKPKKQFPTQTVVAWIVVLIQISLTGFAMHFDKHGQSTGHALNTILSTTAFSLLQCSGNIRRRTSVQALDGKSKTVVLTPGNGSRHALVIVSWDGTGLDLEQLATVNVIPRHFSVMLQQILAILVVAYTIVVKPDAVLVGASLIGSLYNIWLALRPSSFGIDMDHVVSVEPEQGNDKVFPILQKLDEEVLPGAGLALVPVLFPGELRLEEAEWVEGRKKLAKAAEAEINTARPSRRKA